MSSWRPERGATLAPLTAEPEGRANGARPGLRVAPKPAAGNRSGRFDRGRVRTLMLVDLLAIQLALLGMYGLAEFVGPPAFIAPNWLIAALWPAVSLAWIVVFATYRLYEGETRAIAPASFDEVGKTFHALLAGSLVLLVIGQGLEKLADLSVYTPLEALMFMAIALVLMPSFRGALRTWVLPAVMRPRRTIIVGAGPVGQLVRRKIEAHPEYGLDLVGFVDDRPKGETQLGRISDLTRLVDEREIDWVVIADSDAPYDDTLALLRAVRRPDVHLSIVPTYFELFASNATIEDIEGMPVVSLPPMRFSRTVRALKRSVDVLASGLGLLVLSPLLLVSAIAVRLDSPGPVFFRQLRHGRGGREFAIVKFRTMRDGAEAERFALAEQNEMEGGGPLFKIHEDPRITRVGGILRKWSIDELPQLWNVLRGEMSLVGPRPFVVHESEQITGWAGRRLDTTPGITGLWQVLGRNDIPFEEMVKLDYIYVTNWSLWWDIKILCQTLPVVLARRGAY
jgi:exopolysaccharide biosynthesis polyprenyl glycosylphosphotransferase